MTQLNPMYISQVRIRRFKKLEHCDVPLTPLTVVIGGNNSGKTSLLQALHFAISLLHRVRQVDPSRDTADEKTYTLQKGDLPYSPQAETATAAYGSELGEKPAKAISITLVSRDGTELSTELRRGRGENLKFSVHGANYIAAPIDDDDDVDDDPGLSSIYVPGLSGVPQSEEFRALGSLKRIIGRGDSNLALRSVLWHLRQEETRWATFIEDLRGVFTHVDIRVEFNQASDERVRIYYDTLTERDLPLDSAGIGLVKTIQILSYAHLFQPALLLLDEPDAHLSPDRQRRLCKVLATLASRDARQIVLSTHSRHMLDELRYDASIAWLCNGVLCPPQDNAIPAMLMEMGALDSVEYLADKSIKCVVAGEDRKLPAIRTIVQANGFVMSETAVIAYNGCDKFYAVEVLSDFLRNVAPQIKLVVHRDRDYLSVDSAQRFEQNCQSKGIHSFITRPTSIEGYFLSTEHLSQATGISCTQVQAIVDEATKEVEEHSIQRIASTIPDFSQNPAAAMNEARQRYNANPDDLRAAKHVFGRVKAALHRQLKTNPAVFQPSDALRDPTLLKIARTLWPSCHGPPTASASG
jgi:predicted ATPase